MEDTVLEYLAGRKRKYSCWSTTRQHLPQAAAKHRLLMRTASVLRKNDSVLILNSIVLKKLSAVDILRERMERRARDMPPFCVRVSFTKFTASFHFFSARIYFHFMLFALLIVLDNFLLQLICVSKLREMQILKPL